MREPRTIIILLAGGGSGGHVYPLVAVAERMANMAVEHNVLVRFHYIGPGDAYSTALADIGAKTHSLISGKIKRYSILESLLDLPKFFFGFCQALAKLLILMPDVIFSKGGSGAFPVVLAGWFYRIPIVIHESDAVPGLTNLVSARFAKRIAVSFESALKYFNPKKTAWTGNPIRRDLLTDVPQKEAAKKMLHFNANESLTLILGGSQGSERTNRFILENLKQLSSITQILHQTGPANFEEVQRLSQSALNEKPEPFHDTRRYQAIPFIGRELKAAYAAADLVISRAGSGAIYEIAAFGKPAVLIPLPESANNHQRINAYEFARSGGAVVIEEANLLPGIFLRQIEEIFEKPGLIQKMSEASRSFFKSGAAETIAQEIYRIIE